MSRYKVFWATLWPVYYQVPIFQRVDKLRNVDLTVIYFDDKGLRPYYEPEMGVVRDHNEFDLLRGYKYKFLKNLMPHNNDKGFFTLINPSIAWYVTRNKPDVVFIQSYATLSDWLAMFFAKIMGSRVIFRGEATLRRTKQNTLFASAKYLFLRIWLKKCDLVMYSCSGNRSYWKHYEVPDDKLMPIPCAVDNNFYRDEYTKHIKTFEAIRSSLGISRKDFVIIFSARLSPRKRPLDLLKALTSVDCSDIVVLFVGDGAERSSIKKFAIDNKIKIKLVGFQNHHNISKYYSIANLSVVISDYDPSPKALNEAMNFELPVIVTDVVGTSEDLVAENVNGFVVEVGNTQAIAEKVAFLNKNRDIAKRMGKHSVEIISNWNFSKDAHWVSRAVDKVMVQ